MLDDIYENKSGCFDDDFEAFKEYTKGKMKIRTISSRYKCTSDRYTSIQHLNESEYDEAKKEIHEIDRRKYLMKKFSGAYDNLPKNEVLKECKNCEVGFIIKTWDASRGRGRYCSRSCSSQATFNRKIKNNK